jgi:hypothetical protein
MSRISYIVILVSFTASLLAHDMNITSKRILPVQKKIIDIVIKEDKQILLTEDNEIVELSKEGAVKSQSFANSKDFYELKIGGSLPSNIDINRYTYLTKGDGIYYGCIFDWSWSSRIVKIDPQTGKEEFFWYLKGIPSGMFYKNGNLWYLSNRGLPGSLSIIRKINGNTGLKSLEIGDVPIVNAKGLSIDDEGVFTTYENESNSLVRFKITE